VRTVFLLKCLFYKTLLVESLPAEAGLVTTCPDLSGD